MTKFLFFNPEQMKEAISEMKGYVYARKETPTIKYQGKRFVRLCNCNSDWDAIYRQARHSAYKVFIDDPPCPTCDLWYWIILPKEGK